MSEERKSLLEDMAAGFKSKGGAIALAVAFIVGAALGSTYCASSGEGPPIQVQGDRD